MPHPLDSARLKLQRAHEHVTEFEGLVAAFLDEHPYTIDAKHDSKTGDLVCQVIVHRDPPPMFGAIVGDIVHNLRSALDHLVWQLVVANGRTPNTLTEFPVIWDAEVPKNPVKYERLFKRKVRGAPDEAIALIDAMQPYRVPDAEVPDPLQHPLSLLQALDIRDKHQALNVVGGASIAHRIELGRPEKGHHWQLAGGIERSVSPLKTGAELFRIPAGEIAALYRSSRGVLDKSDVKGDVTFSAVIENILPGLDGEIRILLPTMALLVEHSIGHFVPFFG